MEIVRCKRCVMDNASDTSIVFNELGYCNYCTNALERKKKVYYPNQNIFGGNNPHLDALLTKVKQEGKGKKYDCIMGISGGLDSSYLAYLGYKWGLRVLAVHIDDGYDTQISKSNIQKLIEATHFDYEIISPDREQFDDLSLAYLKAGVCNIAAPQDNVLFAFLYEKMKENKIRYFFSGGNFALESILQKGVYNSSDIVNIFDIHRRFGTKKIDKLRFISSFQRYIGTKLQHIESPRPLNYIDYNRERAFKELKEFCGFEYYGGKHLENIWTAFTQLYWLPHKFGIDKRTSHYSSMIISGQLTREEALRELQKPLYDENMMNDYIGIIKERLGISDSLFDKLMSAPVHEHTEYKVEDDLLGYKVLKRILAIRNRIL